MSDSVNQHQAQAPHTLRCGVITISDTRTRETDKGGGLVIELLEQARHRVVAREIVPDEPRRIQHAIRKMSETADIDAILLTGGTGISRRDQTPEAVADLLTKAIPGYGELFRMLSFEEIGAAAMLSRAVGGIFDRVVILTMPGSTAAIRLAMTRLILPELPHLVHEATK